MTPFEKLYKEYDKIFKYCTFKYQNINCIEDILQNCYVRFFESYLAKHDPSKSELKTYFINYIHMECLSYTRSKEYLRNNMSLDAPFDGMSLYDTIPSIVEPETIDKMAILNTIVAGFNERRLTHYKYLRKWVDGMSYQEIADENNINLSTLKTFIRVIRTYICDKYSTITGEKIEFKKSTTERKHKEWDRMYYIKNRDKKLAYSKEYKLNKKKEEKYL